MDGIGQKLYAQALAWESDQSGLGLIISIDFVANRRLIKDEQIWIAAVTVLSICCLTATQIAISRIQHICNTGTPVKILCHVSGIIQKPTASRTHPDLVFASTARLFFRRDVSQRGHSVGHP